MHPYLLPHEVFVCRCEAAVIFLDLRRDKYFGLGAPDFPEAASTLFGWPAVDRNAAWRPENEAQTSSLADQLVEKGLLTTDVARGRLPALTVAERATVTALDSQVEVSKPVLSVHGWRVARAAATVALRLRCGSLLTVVRHLRRRCSGGRTARPFNPGVDRGLIDVFCRVRPLVFTSRQKCLYDSLVLAEFLASYALRPGVFIGVATKPFRAHCWVQEGGMVLNDEVERVNQYTPILVI